MITEVFKSLKGSDVLIIRPVSEGSLMRVGGTWGQAEGPLSGEELNEGWIPVRDISEASKLVKEATSSSMVSSAA